MSGVTTSSLSLDRSLRNWVILDYEEANGLTIRPWAPFLLSFIGCSVDGRRKLSLVFPSPAIMERELCLKVEAWWPLDVMVEASWRRIWSGGLSSSCGQSVRRKMSWNDGSCLSLPLLNVFSFHLRIGYNRLSLTSWAPFLLSFIGCSVDGRRKLSLVPAIS